MRKATIALLLVFAVVLMSFSMVSAQDDLLFPIGEDDRFSWDSLDPFMEMDFSGEEISILGPWLTTDEEFFLNVIAYFEAATGADIVHAGSDNFEQQIIIDIEGGSPPNIAIFPQPGLAADVASDGNLTPLGDELRDGLLNAYAAGQSWVDIGTYADPEGNDQFYGLTFRVDPKSMVWYVPDNFADAGYEIPETMEDLLALTDQIVEDGGTPWCIGLESGGATGWPATDWIEDILLRIEPPEVYDQWTTHEIPFNDERVVEAIEIFESIVKNDAYVNGGTDAVATTSFRDAPNGLFTAPPECYLHKQASFIAGFFPEDVEVGVDADFFYFPPFASEDLGNPVMGGATIFAVTDPSDATMAFMEYLLTPLANEIFMAQGSFTTPHLTANPDVYVTSVLARQGELLVNADTFRFDGSDLMPGAIGAGAFWTGMVDFVSTDLSAQEVADQIEEVWAGLE